MHETGYEYLSQIPGVGHTPRAAVNPGIGVNSQMKFHVFCRADIQNPVSVFDQIFHSLSQRE